MHIAAKPEPPLTNRTEYATIIYKHKIGGHEMILSDRTIMQMLEEGTLGISPLNKEQIQPASVDIRLGDTFSIVEDTSSGIISLESEIRYKTIKTDTYLLLPGQFCSLLPQRGGTSGQLWKLAG